MVFILTCKVMANEMKRQGFNTGIFSRLFIFGVFMEIIKIYC